MSKFSLAMNKVGAFLKRNAFYLLIILCVASIATVIALAVTRDTTSLPADSIVDDNKDTPVVKPDDNPPVENPPIEQPPVEDKQTFISPCNDGTVSKNYSDTQLVWSPTLSEFSTHMALDFTSSDLNVYATDAGKIKEIGYNALDGNYVVIEHDNGYVSKYLSLDSAPELTVGAKVTQGQLLGKMGTSQGSEALDGAHLHFEMYKDGEAINPLEVLLLSEK